MAMYGSFQDYRKNSPLITLACYKYEISLFAVSAVALNSTFWFVYSSKAKCVNMVVIYMLCLEV